MPLLNTSSGCPRHSLLRATAPSWSGPCLQLRLTSNLSLITPLVLRAFLLPPESKLLYFLFPLPGIPPGSNMTYCFPSIWVLPNATSSENPYLTITLTVHPPSHPNVHSSLIPLYFSSQCSSPPEIKCCSCLLTCLLAISSMRARSINLWISSIRMLPDKYINIAMSLFRCWVVSQIYSLFICSSPQALLYLWLKCPSQKKKLLGVIYWCRSSRSHKIGRIVTRK